MSKSTKDMPQLKDFLGRLTFASRWILYPVNIGLLLALAVYVGHFLYEIFEFLVSVEKYTVESLMIVLLGFVDASMVANLIIMIVQGGHQIFIQKFSMSNKDETPQYLDNIDTGILKVKVAQSICSIMLIQQLRDSVNVSNVDWTLIQHRLIILMASLLSALVMSIIWRITHPPHGHKKSDAGSGVRHHDQPPPGELGQVPAVGQPKTGQREHHGKPSRD